MRVSAVNEEEKAKAYIELYRIQLERFDKRRDIEWKVTIGLWTGIAILTGFLAGKVQLGWPDLWIYILVWGVFSFLWTSNNRFANRRDMNFALVYLNRIELLIDHTVKKIEFQMPRRRDFLRDWSRISQIVATAVIMLLSWYFLHIIPIQPGTS